MSYWQPPPWQRSQMVLFAPTLEERIPEDHPVRLLDEILAAYDWGEWECNTTDDVDSPRFIRGFWLR